MKVHRVRNQPGFRSPGVFCLSNSSLKYVMVAVLLTAGAAVLRLVHFLRCQWDTMAGSGQEGCHICSCLASRSSLVSVAAQSVKQQKCLTYAPTRYNGVARLHFIAPRICPRVCARVCRTTKKVTMKRPRNSEKLHLPPKSLSS